MSTIDQIALDTVQAIAEIDPDKLKGGKAQAMAQAQCLVIGAIEQAARAQGVTVPMKRIAEKKLDQMGATVHGVLVRNEAGAWAAVSDAGRVMWLDNFEGRDSSAQPEQPSAGVVPEGWKFDLAEFARRMDHQLDAAHDMSGFEPIILHIAESVLTAAPTAQAVQSGGVPVVFGNGDKVVEVGTYGGRPAVFVSPAEPSGTPGELAPPTTGEDKHRLVPGEWVMTFPTEEQAFEVADALVGRHLNKLDDTHPHNGEQGGEWVRCDERLPTDESTVLAFVDDYSEPMVVPARYSANSEQWFDVECVDRDGDQNTLYQVILWTPMPNPPTNRAGGRP